jgi:hypothetical protein
MTRDTFLTKFDHVTPLPQNLPQNLKMFNTIYLLATGQKKKHERLSSIEPFPETPKEEEPPTLEVRQRHLKTAIKNLTKNSRWDCNEYSANNGAPFTIESETADKSTWKRITETKWCDLLEKHQRILQDYKDLFGMLYIKEVVNAIWPEDHMDWIVEQAADIKYHLKINGCRKPVEIVKFFQGLDGWWRTLMGRRCLVVKLQVHLHKYKIGFNI